MINFDFMTDWEIIEGTKPKNPKEEEFLKIAYRNLGELTTINRLSKFLGMGKSTIYKALSERKLIAYKTGNKNLILTKTILNIITSNEE